MRMRKRWVKATVAMIAMIAMLTETAYSAVASVSTEYASQESSTSTSTSETPPTEPTPPPENTAPPANTAPPENTAPPANTTPAGSTTPTENTTPTESTTPPENTTLTEGTTPTITVSPEGTISDGSITEPQDTEITDGVVSASVNSFEDRIEGTGMSELTLYVNTDQMNSSDRYQIKFEGSASMQYDSVLNGELSKSNSGIYYITGLNNEQFRTYANISTGMTVQYSVREDGNPQITLISAPEEEVQKKLEVSSDGTQITGEGYDAVTLTFETPELPDENYFSLNVNTSAEASYNGSKIVNGSIPSLSNTTTSIRLSDLNKKSFSLYIAGENIDAVNAVYSIDSVENGAARIVVAPGEGAQKVQSLNASSDGIAGSGYQKIELSMEYIEKIIETAKETAEEETDAAETPEDAEAAPEAEKVFKYSLFVETDAEDAAVNGQKLAGGKVDFTDAMESVVIDGLDEESFRIYAAAEEAEDITEPAKLSYSVTSKDAGTAKIAFTYTTEAEETANKRIYEYEDDYVAIKVTLQKPEDLPDEAELHADPVTAENNPEYYASIGKQIDENTPETELELVNYVAYDVYFTLDGEEVEPENRVDVKITYKQKHEEAETDLPVEEVKTFHLKEDENGSVVSVDDVTGSVSTDGQGSVKEVEIQVDGFSIIVAGEYANIPTFLDNGGSYSLGYILNNFNIFVKGNTTAGHTVGNVAVGGESSFNAGIGSSKYSRTTPVYLKGTANVNDIANRTQMELFGKVNQVTGSSSERFKANGYSIGYTNNYIDFNEAFSKLSAEASSVGGDIKITAANIDTYNKGGYRGNHFSVEKSWEGSARAVVKIDTGYSYEFETFNNVSVIDIQGDTINSESDTTIVCKNSSITVPITFFNGSGNVVGDAEVQSGSSIAFIFANASSVSIPASHRHMGHIVAPNAAVTRSSSDYNGCIIASSFETNAEGHMWPYNGTKFQPTATGFSAVKTVDGETPSADQVFTFTLEEWNGSAWNTIQTKQNSGSAVAFDQITYGKGKDGTYYYRVKEAASTAGGYTYDTTNYVVKVEVTSSTSGGDTTQSNTTTYYFGENIADAVEANRATAMAFDNKTEAGQLSVKKVLTGSASASEFYFTVSNSAGELIGNPAGGTVFAVAANDAGGVVITGLPYGDYTVTETDVNGTALVQDKPYHITYSSQSVSLSAAAPAADVTITNAIGSLTVKKVRTTGTDDTFYFTVHDSQNKIIKNGSSDVWSVAANGQTVISDLPFGNYKITEVKDSAGNPIDDAFGYVVSYSNTNQIAAITTEKPAAEFTITNEEKPKGEVTVVKEDYIDCYFLEGGTFRLYKADGTPVYVTGSGGNYTYVEGTAGVLDMVTAGEGGSFTVKELPWGSYYFKETNPPAGYLYNSNITLRFTVSAQGVTNTTTDLMGTLIKGESTDSFALKYYVMNERKPFRLKITKTYTSTTGQVTALGGVEFTLYKYNEKTNAYEFYEKGVTAPDGTYTFENLPWGSYKYEETGVPDGYTVTGTSTGEFVINASSEIFTCGNPCGMPIYDVAVENRPISGGVELTKTSDRNTVLSGAKFELWKNGENGQSDASIIYASDKRSGNYEYSVTAAGATSTLVTNQSGKINITKLPAGTYFFKEIEAPSGYVAVTGNVGGFTIDKEAETERVTVVNTTFEAGVTFTKVDATDNTIKLPGTRFALYYKPIGGSFTKLSEVEADGSGVVTVNGLALGEYYFVEIEAKTGYELDATERHFTIENSNAGQIVTLTGNGITDGLLGNSREKGQVSLSKTNAGGAAMNGVTFELWSDSAEYSGAVHDGYRKVGTYRTIGGAIKVDNLPWGHYYFIETKTLDGYQLDGTKHYFEINADNLDVKFEGNNRIVNQTVKGYVELIKQDRADRSLLLNGVEFDLYRVSSDGSEVKIGTYPTVNGKISKETIGALDYGEYYFVESKTIDGYKLNNTKYPVYITEQDQVVTVTVQNERELGKVTFEKWNEEKTAQLDGAVYELYSTNTNSLWDNIQSIFGKTYYKYGEYTLTGGTVTISNLPWGNYYFVEKTAPAGYVLDTETKHQFTIGADSLDVQLTNANNKAAYDSEEKGSIRLVKTDSEDASPLAGAEFALYKDGERYPNNTTTYFTNADGEITVDNLPFGTYYFVELQAPAGYETPTGDAARTASVTISASNTGAAVTPERTISFSNNELYGSLDLTKVDGSGTALSGAQFYLTKMDGNSEKYVKLNGSAGVYVFDRLGGFLSTKQVLDTTAGGKLSITELPYGSYKVYEETAPEGYNKVASPYEFTIGADGAQNQTVAYDFVNTQIQAGVRFLKVDAAHELLGGAVFHLYKVGTAGADEDLGTVTVASNGSAKGVVEKQGLGAGSYYFIEETAPTGYVDNTKRYEFTITAADNGNTVGLTNADVTVNGQDAVVNTQKLGSARLTKTIAGSNTGLAGAKFDLYKSGDNSPIKTGITSDGNGYVNAADLAWGTYYFVETEAPNGYALDETHYEFTVNADNVSALIVTGRNGAALRAENTLILGQAKLTKYDSVTDKVLAGATFDLYNASTRQIVAGYEDGITSDAKGVIQTNKDLPAGNYYFKERSVPAGYVLDATEYSFTINQQNMDTVVLAGINGRAYNTPKSGKAELFKYVLDADGRTQTGLQGAKFNLYKKNSAGIFNLFKENVGEYTTGEAGTILVEDLPWGEYYFEETTPPAGYQKLTGEAGRIRFTISAAQLDYTGAARLSLANEAYKGSIRLVKTETGNDTKIEGAVFRLYKVVQGSAVEIKNAQNADGTYITDRKGEIIVTDLDWADYYFVEISAPEGYAMPAHTQTATIHLTKDNAAGSVDSPLTVNVENTKVYGNVELTKIDDATPAKALAGAQFELYTRAGARVYVTGESGDYSYSTEATTVVLETPASGKLVVKQLPYGEYYFRETKAPSGYIIKPGNINFSITTNQAADAAPLVTVSHMNSAVSAGVSFVKADTTADHPLQGAVFTLWKVGAGGNGEDKQLSDYTSDVNGVVSATGLGVGSYYFVEKSTPNDAYRLSSTHYTFTITDADNGKTVGLTNAGLNGVVINLPKYGSVELTKYATVGGTRVGTLAGATFDLYKGEASSPAVDPTTVGEKLDSYTVKANGKIEISNLEWGKYFFIETSAPAGYTIEKNSGGFNRPYNFEIDANNVTNVRLVTVNNERSQGSVEIEKVSSDNNAPLDGVVFELYKSYGTAEQELVATLTTADGGRASADGLSWGSYTLIEKTGLSGYVENKTQYTFTIDGTHQKQSYTGNNAIENKKIQGYVELEKKNSVTKQPMADVEFQLYKGDTVNGEYIGTYSTNAEGKLVQDGKTQVGPLDMGSYYFIETTPTGYAEYTGNLAFTIEKDGQVVRFTGKDAIENTPQRGSVKLKKVDENGAPLANAQFTITATTPGNLSQTIQTLLHGKYENGKYYTNENGELEVNNLPWDTYYIQETKAPQGYQILDDTQHTFTIDAQNANATVDLGTFINGKQKGSIKLTKTDAETRAALAGAEFKLYLKGTEGAADTDVSSLYEAPGGVFTTTADGTITVSNLEWGTYYFQETKAPAGYEEVSATNVVKSTDVTINAGNADAATNVMQHQTVGVTNAKGYGYVSLRKTFDGTQPADLSNIGFTLVNKDTGAKVGDFTTNSEGVISAAEIGRLPYGTYYFAETSVPVGVSYSVSDFKLEFSITASYPIAEAVEYTFTNSEIKAGAGFGKIDADTGENISGIQFDVKNAADDSQVTQVTSNNQGIVAVTGLPMGSYYFEENAESAAAAGYTVSLPLTRYYFDITAADAPTENADGTKTEKFVEVYTVDASGNRTAITTVENTKLNGSIELVKFGKDSTGTTQTLALTDAEFELYKDGALYMNAEQLKVLYSAGKLVVKDLPWGKYYFKETKAPAGYSLPEGSAANTTEVTIDGTTATGSLTTPLTCQMTDDTNRIYISKREIGGADELTGASMELYAADAAGNRTGEALVSWTSGATSKLFEIGAELADGLVAGQSYVLHEAKAPAGYSLTKDIAFTVNADGSITTTARTSGSGNGTTLIMEDAGIDVTISKKELNTTVELPGASLRIMKGSDLVEEWQTNGQPHKVLATLEVGASYTLEEVNAPDGYYTAEPITFEIQADGKINVTKDASASAEAAVTESGSNSLTMYDRPIRLEISKKRLTGGAEDYVEGAGLTLYGETADGGWEIIYTWTSPAAGAVLIPYGKLLVGNKYKVVETTVPAGYVKADDITFTVKDYSSFTQTDAEGQVTQSETILDGMTKVIVSKQSITGETELPGAELEITAEDGTPVASWTSGTKPVLLTTLASSSALSATERAEYADYEVIYNVALSAGASYTLTEKSAPDGYALAAPVTFKVDEKGVTRPSPVVMKDKPLEIALSKQDMRGNALAGATMQLLDRDMNLVHEWESSDKPVLFTQRTLSASEAAKYAEVVQAVLMETKDDSAPYTYTLRETKAPTGYETAADLTFTIKGSDVVDDSGNVRTEIMKDAEGGETSLSGTKTWVIPKNPDGSALTNYTYPDVTIELYRDSAQKGVMDTTPVNTLVLTNGAENYTFGPLEQYKYKAAGGVDYEYTYTVKEKMSADAEAKFDSEEITDASGNVTGFTNRLKQEKTYLNGEKVWVLYRDENGNIDRTKDYADVTIYLLRNGVRVDADGDGKVDSVTIKNGAAGTNGRETFRFDDLDKYDLSTGNEYVYTVEEVGDPDGTYDSEITYLEHECKVVNVPFHDPFRISGRKLWVDPVGTTRPDVTIELYRDGRLYDTTKLNADNTFEFSGLYEYNLGWSNDAYDNKATADGHKFVYSLRETGAANYSFAVDFNGTAAALNSSGFAVFNGAVPDNSVISADITNTITQEYIELSGRKFWDDAGDASRRPTVTINLYATDTAGRSHALVDTYLLSNTSTTYSFGTAGRVRLPRYDTNGQIITYTVEEAALPGYTSTQRGNDFTNTPSRVRISKLDATTSAELPGAVLALTRVSTGAEVDRWTSTTTPHYVEGLDLGAEYRLTEISAPTGYAVASPVTFTVRTDGVEQTVTMRDERIVGSVTLTKRDATTREALAGAVFSLYTSDGTLVRTTGTAGSYTYSDSAAGTTALAVSAAGTLSVTGLPYGSYYFREVTAPAGYTLSTAAEGFTIAEAGAAPTVTFLNTRSVGAVRLTKTNVGGSTALAGAVFELYSRTPRTVGQAAASTIYSDAYYRYGTYTSSASGEIYVGDLPWDDYYFIEVTAPAGYTINRDTNGDPLVYTFRVDSTSAAAVSVSLGSITNGTGGDGGGGDGGGVAGARREGGVLSGVLGVRAAPTSGVLGERVGPVTGDAANIALWIILLAASIGIIVAICVQNARKKTRRKSRRQ